MRLVAAWLNSEGRGGTIQPHAPMEGDLDMHERDMHAVGSPGHTGLSPSVSGNVKSHLSIAKFKHGVWFDVRRTFAERLERTAPPNRRTFWSKLCCFFLEFF